MSLSCNLRKFEDKCGDMREFFLDEILDDYDIIIKCIACADDENETMGFLYHPNCFVTKHEVMNEKLKRSHIDR